MGPSLVVLGTNVEGTSAQIPSDGVVQIAFDRYLLPSTIVRQSYLILDANRKPTTALALRTVYDPIARTVTIAGPGGPGTEWLTPDQTYHLVLGNVSDDKDQGAFRAIDRATLAAPLDYTFRAGAPTGVKSIDKPVDFCRDVLPLFTLKCSGSTCHGAGGEGHQAAGLVLTTSDAVRNTAIDHIAHASTTGAAIRATQDKTLSKIFGVDMPIISPDDPGFSWLLYKVELAPHPRVDAGPKPTFACTVTSPPSDTSYEPLVGSVRREASDLDRAILHDYVIGREMPYPVPPSNLIPQMPGASAYSATPLTFEEREQIRAWIAAGAPTPSCGSCGEVTDADAGDAGSAVDAATGLDAGTDAADGGSGDGG